MRGAGFALHIVLEGVVAAPWVFMKAALGVMVG